MNRLILTTIVVLALMGLYEMVNSEGELDPVNVGETLDQKGTKSVGGTCGRRKCRKGFSCMTKCRARCVSQRANEECKDGSGNVVKPESQPTRGTKCSSDCMCRGDSGTSKDVCGCGRCVAKTDKGATVTTPLICYNVLDCTGGTECVGDCNQPGANGTCKEILSTKPQEVVVTTKPAPGGLLGLL